MFLAAVEDKFAATASLQRFRALANGTRMHKHYFCSVLSHIVMSAAQKIHAVDTGIFFAIAYLG